jgi:hypothetical protein
LVKILVLFRLDLFLILVFRAIFLNGFLIDA